MKKLVFLILPVLIFTGCNQQPPKSESFTVQDAFSQNVQCASLSLQTQEKINEESQVTNRNVILYKPPFYSSKYDSCLYAYVIEDDSRPDCNIEAEIIHYDRFVIKNLLTGEIILSKTKGCDDFWGDDFDISLNDLEK